MMNWQKLQDRPALQQYGLTLFLVICALAIRLALYPVIADRAPYVFFFSWWQLSAVFGGRGQGCSPLFWEGWRLGISSSSHNSHSLSRSNATASP